MYWYRKCQEYHQSSSEIGRAHRRFSGGQKRKQRIIIRFNKNILSSTVFKTPKNYIDNWRKKVATKDSGNALFLQPNGTRVTGKYIRDHITHNRKKDRRTILPPLHHETHLRNLSLRIHQRTRNPPKTTRTPKTIHDHHLRPHR